MDSADEQISDLRAMLLKIVHESDMRSFPDDFYPISHDTMTACDALLDATKPKPSAPPACRVRTSS